MYLLTRSDVLRLEELQPNAKPTKSVEVLARETGLECDAVANGLSVVRILPAIREGQSAERIAKENGLQIDWVGHAMLMME